MSSSLRYRYSSPKYYDEKYEYIIVTVATKERERFLKKYGSILLTASQYIDLGIFVDDTWEHFSLCKLEPHNLLFRRKIA